MHAKITINSNLEIVVHKLKKNFYVQYDKQCD